MMDWVLGLEEHTNRFRATHALPDTYLSPSNISDRVQCYTDIEPHVDRDMSLSGLVVAGAELNETISADKSVTGSKLLVT